MHVLNTYVSVLMKTDHYTRAHITQTMTYSSSLTPDAVVAAVAISSSVATCQPCGEEAHTSPGVRWVVLGQSGSRTPCSRMMFADGPHPVCLRLPYRALAYLRFYHYCERKGHEIDGCFKNELWLFRSEFPNW